MSIRLRLHLLIASLAAVASVSLTSAALSAEPRVAVLEPPASLLDAISVALSPWGLRVVPVAEHPPAVDVGATVQAARTLARDHDAAAVLWVATAPGGAPSLWVYDAQTEQLTVRPLSQAPPFDDASAAAVALTVKTLLRGTTVAPPKERVSPVNGALGSAAPAPSALPSGASPAAIGSAARAPAGASSAPNGSASPVTSATAPPAPAPSSTLPTHAIGVDARLLVRVPTGASTTTAPRVGLGLGYWPRAWRERFGLGLDVELGTNLDVSTPTYTGSFSDTTVGLTARARLFGEPFSLEVHVGPSLHVTSLSGASLTGRAPSVTRGDPSLDIALVPQLSLGARVRLGLYFGAGALLRSQRYTLHDDLVLEVPTFAVGLGGRASLALD